MMPARERATQAWAPTIPDWIGALADACDRGSQRQVAELLRVSPTTVSLILANKWAPRSHAEMEERVRASALMVRIVVCSVLGVLSRAECRQRQTAELVTCNPVSVQLYRACRAGCQFYEQQGGTQ